MKTLKIFITNDFIHQHHSANGAWQSLSKRKISLPFTLISAFASILIFCLSSCKKFVQIPPPQTQLVTTSVFSNNSTATAAQVYIYTQISNVGESSKMGINTGLQGDELKNYSTQSGQIRLYTNALTASISDGGWTRYYNYIYQANAVIEGLQKYTGSSPAVNQQLTGEAKFIRAFWYFYLTNLYGDVPLVLGTDYKINNSIARTPREQVLQQVITDLKDAQNLLNTNYVDASDTLKTSERVRPNQSAATALLSRAYLYLGDYSKSPTNYVNSESQATTVISNSLYSLSPLTGTNSVFMKNSSEAIWQIQTALPATSDTNDGFVFILTGAPNTGNAFQYSTISQQLLGSFETGDLRKVNWIGSINTTPANTYYFPNKYKGTSSNYSASNIKEYVMVLRLAEQYLIRAEARAQQGNTTGAVSDLNVIRKRAGLLDYAGATDKASLLTAILHERQVELFTEWGHRWMDLNRTGNTNAIMSLVTPLKGGTWSTDGHQQLYPIPSADIVNNSNLLQNPGY